MTALQIIDECKGSAGKRNKMLILFGYACPECNKLLAPGAICPWRGVHQRGVRVVNRRNASKQS